MASLSLTTSSLRSRSIRWAAPVVVAAVIGSFALIPTLSASATPSLAPITAQQLLVKVQQANVKALSGTIRLTSNLGIPNLSSLAGAAGRGDGVFNPTDLLSGSHDAQVWIDGPDRQRVALPSSLSEVDFIHNGADVYTWQSSGSRVTHKQIAAGHGEAKPASGTKTAPIETPSQVATQILDQITPSTTVLVTTPAYVAGRPVYELVLRPNAKESTVDHVGIAVDSATGLPLQVSLFAKGQAKAALELGFTSVSFSRPATSVFRFTPPPNANINGAKDPAQGDAVRVGGFASRRGRVAMAVPVPMAGPASSGSTKTKVVGQDWTQIVLGSSIGQLSGQAGLVLKAATPVSGNWGSGSLFHTALINVLVLNDGRIAAGAVTPAALEAAVASAH